MGTGHYSDSTVAYNSMLGVVTPSNGKAMDNTVRIRENIRQVFAATKPIYTGNERRRDKREPFPYPIYLTPVEKDGTFSSEKTIVVIGKQLSEMGFDFYHRDPLPYRRVIASFEITANQWLGFMADLTWCRFGRHGWYDNGGRFIAPVRSPMSEAPQASTGS
jgi:hypothetical protein